MPTWHNTMKPILEVQHIYKRFALGVKQESYLSLRDAIMRPFAKRASSDKTFLALDDVSFNVYPGQSIGIIGRNGAGKSTLLKILSRITPPTSGKVISRGRIASLLEVGTGFHPELTGRENIYMNGSILGMRKAEINKHFDEIVDFSGVEKFLDTPLKRYSSGMQLRLAFAVAAHLEPEILIIDEVLAVGDTEFQKKCLGKMNEVSKSGRTILFVSHQLSVIRSLCQRGVLLQNGRLVCDDSIDKAIQTYTEGKGNQLTSEYIRSQEYADAQPDSFFERIVCSQASLSMGDDLEIEITFAEKYLGRDLIINANIFDYSDDLIAHVINADDAFLTGGLTSRTIKLRIERINLPKGNYYINFWAGFDMIYCIEELKKVLSFSIDESLTFIKRNTEYPSNAKIVFKSKWSEK